MLESNDLPVISDPQPATCAINGCAHHGILRAVLYTPVILFAGALAAVATFPNLAEYATPLIGDSGQSCSRPPSTACHSSCSSGMPAQVDSASEGISSECVLSGASSCTTSGCCPLSQRSSVLTVEAVLDAAGSPATQSTSENPADALTAVDSTQVQ